MRVGTRIVSITCLLASRPVEGGCSPLTSSCKPSCLTPPLCSTQPANIVIQGEFERCLRPRLSPQGSIVLQSSAVPRWSEYEAPRPGTVVNVGNENDVAESVKCANTLGVNFLAQSGGNGWATTFNIGSRDVIINLRPLRAVSFNSQRTEVTVQGGAIISEVINAAYEHDTQVVTGNCNCVGVTGALLGGGYGRLMGQYGLMVDNVLSFRMVDANGAFRVVTPTSDPRLWWALRGAGPNFGIITSVRMRSFPTPREENVGFISTMIFTPDKVEQLVTAIDNLRLEPRMAIFLAFVTSGTPDYIPVPSAIAFFNGPAGEAEAAFASIYAVGPFQNITAETPYNQANAGSEPFCVRGGRKPSYGGAQGSLPPTTWRSIYNRFAEFVTTNTGAKVGNTSILVEAYSLDAARSLGDESSAYPWRSTNRYNTLISPVYADASLDGAAERFGSDIRSELRKTSGLQGNPTYINFAHGDERLSEIYGPNLRRLQEAKRYYDPSNRFNQWFSLA